MATTGKPNLATIKKKKRIPKQKKNKILEEAKSLKSDSLNPNQISNKEFVGGTLSQSVLDKYPVLKNEELVQKFRNVPMTNNQKGRIRQILKDSLQGTTKKLLPDVIHSKIQSILNSKDHLVDTELRKIRILYNMLKTASLEEISTEKNKKTAEKISRTEDKAIGDENMEIIKEPKVEGKGEKKKKVDKTKTTAKGTKRYVVFMGNLPLGIGKEQIKQHMSDIADNIKDIRLPEQKEGKKSAIAYVELKDELSYELALSKHHSMLGNKRINVLYTMQQNSNITKTEAKSRSAKLQALQKSGALLGSVPLTRKRSHRRNKMKQAKAKENQP